MFSRPTSRARKCSRASGWWASATASRPEEISYFTHGTTVGINTVIQRKGLRLALFTTAAFPRRARDRPPQDPGHVQPAVEARRRRSSHAIWSSASPAGCRRDGSEEAPLDEASVAGAPARRAAAAGAEGIVISPCCMPIAIRAHELRGQAIVERLAPGCPVFCSNETWPIIREYERTITAVDRRLCAAARRALPRLPATGAAARPACRPSRA